MHLTLIDTTHSDKPCLHLTAREVIVDSQGCILVNPHTDSVNSDHNSICELIDTINSVGFGSMAVSHDWVVKVY